MRFLISGYYGFNNAGDEAVLAALLDGLRRRFPEAEPCVLSADPQSTRELHGVAAVQRWSLREVWRALGEADVLIQGGGGLVQDTTSRASPVYYLGILRMAAARRVPAMVFAQGVGPLRRPLLRWLAARQFRRAAAITVRDEDSLAQLAAMGVRSPEPVLSADPALLLEPGPEPVEDALCDLGVDPAAPRALLTLRSWPRAESIVPACRELARHLITRHDLEVLVLPFQEPDDVAVSEAVAEAHPRARVLRGIKEPAQLVAHTAGAALVVSMRLHGIVFAASQAVPAIGIAYDPKLNAFAARAKQSVVSLADCTAESLTEMAETTLLGAPALASEREAVARELRAAAELSFDVLEGVVLSS